MDPDLKEIWAALQEHAGGNGDSREPERRAPETLGPTPEDLRDQAFVVASLGEPREAAYMLRRAVNLAESLDAEPARMIPLLEAMAEVLWQLNEKHEARLCANRAIELWFSSRPRSAFHLTLDGRDSPA